jgi:hypothetical protein
MRHIFKVLLLVACWSVWIGFAHAANPADPPAASQAPAASDNAAGQASAIEVPETAYDFGEAMEGEVVKHDFLVKNTGAAVLEISQVRAG